jgi:SpoVK/Ycf46/Vps4 family AAA+-type ATPase
LLTEINGFADRGARVAILAATNRKDLVDPALLERLSEVEVAVERPDLRGARAIFDIHLPATVPFSPNGSAAPETRTAIIETAVTRFYAPNADNELCVLKFRDGKTRTVAARELASGRAFEQVCRAARHAALLRELRGGEPGVSVSDIESAIGEALTKLATTLSPRNAHAFLTDLPADADVLGVTPLRRRVANPRRYLNK